MILRDRADADLRARRRSLAGIHVRADLLFARPTYTFAQPVAGGQAALSLGLAVADMRVGIDATITSRNGSTISGSRRLRAAARVERASCAFLRRLIP